MVRRLGKKAELGNKEFSRVYGQRLVNVGFTWITKVCESWPFNTLPS